MRKGIDCNGKKWTEYTKPYLKRYDITGEVFGDLTALFRVDVDSYRECALWLCKCSCGNEIVARATALRSGHTKSCGCTSYQRVSKALSKELQPGDKFGRYTILYKAGSSETQRSLYRVRCSCGNERTVQRQSLIDGRAQSCGCLQKELISQRTLADLTGRRFGMLTVLSRSDHQGGDGVYWNVRCDCGTEKVVSGHAMKRGATISCGCTRSSAGELSIEKTLLENNVLYKREYIFLDLPRLRYDFVIFDEDQSPLRIIEYDGEQHFKPIDYFGGEKEFEQQKSRDNLKNQYAFNHNIPLIRIPYKERNNITLDLLLGDKYLLTKT
jgi:hypothetical protein